MDLNAADKARISDAIRAAEASTSGEIVCVLARASANTSMVPIFAAILPALALPWPLIALTQLSVQRIYALQLMVFILLALLFSLPALRRRLTPRAFLRAQAHRAAAEQFVMRGLSRTSGRTGVLIFVSLAERYARILADEAITTKVSDKEWRGIIDGLVAHSRSGRVADGFVAAITASGALLARHFPPTAGKPDELPDRIYVI